MSVHTLTVDGEEVAVPAGATLLDAVRAAGAEYCMDEYEVVRNIENAGFTASRRTMHYEHLGIPVFRQRDVPPRVSFALEAAGVHPLLARLLAARGVREADELDDSLARLLPPASRARHQGQP